MTILARSHAGCCLAPLLRWTLSLACAVMFLGITPRITLANTDLTAASVTATAGAAPRKDPATTPPKSKPAAAKKAASKPAVKKSGAAVSKTAKGATSKTSREASTARPASGIVSGSKVTAPSAARKSSVRRKASSTTRRKTQATGSKQRKNGSRTAVSQKRTKAPAPVTVIRAPGLKLTASGRPAPKSAPISTVRGGADSTRIWIGGQPHDARYALFVMPGQELRIEAHVAGGLAQRWEGDGSFEPLPPAGPPTRAQAQLSAVRAGSPRVKVEMPGRVLIWRAPDLAGAAFLTLKTAAPGESGKDAVWKDVTRLNLMVMMPAEQMIAGRLNGYLIGNYPAPRAEQDSTYLPPMAFLKATDRPTRLSPSFFLEDFACHQEHDGERFVALQPRLLPFLEAISGRVKELMSNRRVDVAGRNAPSAAPDPAASAARGAAAKPATATDDDEEGLADTMARAHDAVDAGMPRKPNLPNRPTPPPSFRSSPGDAMLAAASSKLQPIDMAAVVRDRPIKVLSGYRTPAYNRSLGTARLSRHQYGDACDIYVDRDNDGRMDDLNLDGSVDGRDAITLAAWIEDLWQRPEFRGCPGGLGIYNGNGAHGPFVHVDLRGFKARWGGNGLRWNDESESARDLLGQADPWFGTSEELSAAGFEFVTGDAPHHHGDEDAGTIR